MKALVFSRKVDFNFTFSCIIGTEKESGENIGKFRSAGALARAISPALTCAGKCNFFRVCR